MNEPTVMAVDAATTLFNFPNYRVISTTVTVDSCRQVIVESEQPPGCPSCGVIATRRKERRFQRIRYIPVGGSIEVVWRKYRWYCHEPICERRSFFESSAEVPPRARSTGRLRDQLVDAVICSGRAISETAAGVAVSWWMVRAAVNEACIVKLPNVASLHRQLKELPWKGVPVGNKQSYKSHGRTGSSSIKGVTIDGSSYLGMVGGRLYRIKPANHAQ